MTVKADSKGRLTGAEPEKEYDKEVTRDGTITYSPRLPDKFDEERILTWKQFTDFFGSTPKEIVQNSIQTVTYQTRHEGMLHTGIVFDRFVTAPGGGRVYVDGDSLREKVFIRIREQE